MKTVEQWQNLKDDRLVNIRDAAEMLQTSRFTLRAWIKSGKLRAVRLNGQYRIRQSQILALIGGEDA